MAYPRLTYQLCLDSVRAGLRSTRTPATRSTWRGWRRAVCTRRRRRCSVCGRGPCPAPRRAHRWTPRALAATPSSPCTSSSRDSSGWRYELSSHLSLWCNSCSLVILFWTKSRTFVLHCWPHGLYVELISRTMGTKCRSKSLTIMSRFDSPTPPLGTKSKRHLLRLV